MDLRPRSWIVVAALCLLGACCAVAFALVVAVLFHEDASGEHSTAFGLVQLAVAGAGLVFSAVAVVTAPATAAARGGGCWPRRSCTACGGYCC